MKPERGHAAIGCLMIEDLISDGERLNGLSAFLREKGVRTAAFARMRDENLHARLQAGFQEVRRESGAAAIIALGAGCPAALALSAQLPVDRIVLLDDGRAPRCDVPSAWLRQVNRIAGFARRNMSFCVADALLISMGGDSARRRMRTAREGLCNSRVRQVELCGNYRDQIWTNGEYDPQKAIYYFLSTGELPKSLAENPEMCIIYE